MTRRLHVTAVHRNALLGRLTALLGPHDVSGFSYRTVPDGRAHVVVDVEGDDWQVDRVAAKLTRVVDVVEVSAACEATAPGA
ncbi:hypothetical protein [Nocardioides mangrovi]|uniref:Acetolactate synthase n=1 Tax=Nocardioides mangrovi TaxID=2874580 RepID=A0ABS7UDS0_9ACTN|nr:hypothetical protein [Nocardioides mangrovi]MBZ5739150.1 hypothetical protein [Nocardioides mangrovi]